MLAITDGVAKARAKKGAAETIMENSQKYSHESNGVVERGVQSVEGFIHVMKSSLGEKIGKTLDAQDAVWPWLVEYAGWLLNKIQTT